MPAVELPGHRGGGEHTAMRHDRRQLVRHLLNPLPVEANDPRGVLHRPYDRPGEHRRADRVEPELELRADPEVPASTAHPPEEIRVLLLARRNELALGGKHVDAEELIYRQAVLALEPADSPAEGQAREPGMGHDSRRDGEPKGLRLAVQVAQQDAGLSPR